MNNIFNKAFPCFELEQDIVLDNICAESDAAEYFFYMNSPQVRDFISIGNLPSSIEKAKEDLRYWSSLFTVKRGFYWSIRNNKKLIGTIGFNTLSFAHLKGEISYDLSYEYWNKGIMTKAISKIVNFSHKNLNLVRIQACTARNNKKSIKLLERCKFKAEGLMKKFEILNGEHVDYVLYSHILS
jgi:ribosomal-protein-alanine N-acetyltransferase